MEAPNEGQGTSGGRESRYGRKMRIPGEREMGGKRRHRKLEEKLRKYEVLMQELRRYVEGVPADEQTELDRRMARALDETPNGRALITHAVKTDQEIPIELKRRAHRIGRLRPRPPLRRRRELRERRQDLPFVLFQPLANCQL